MARRVDASAEPDVSVVIPVFNKWDVTRRCLLSLARCDADVSVQVIVVDDASSDGTAAALARVPGVDVVRNGLNAGFVDSCNRGAAIARGRYLYFLNNDTELADGALRALLDRAKSDAAIGVVGSKLVYPDGRLQEAGGILWSDAGGWNYGRLDDPARPEYAFVRDADYVSGASLLVPAALFRELGGFDRRYAPAYYEDADLCMAVRERGLRVVYEPRSVVTHYEGISAGTDLGAGMKRFQEINRPKFLEKWRTVLERDHFPPDAAHVRAAARARSGRSGVLVIDSYVPLYDREAGSARLHQLVRGFLQAGERVVFLPDNIAAMQPYAAELQAAGVELLHHTDGDARRARELLIEALPTVDVAWVCRPELCKTYLPLIRAHAGIPVVYDTIDLHHVRMRRQAEIEGGAAEPWQKMEQLELTCARAADGTVVVSGEEAALLERAGVEPVAVVPTIHDVVPAGTRREDTAGLLFIGGYNHQPNVDAVEWLVREIMPRVWNVLPDAHLTLLGAGPPPTVLALAGERVTVTGFVQNVDPYFRAARVFVAPLRFGAGVKGKIGHALMYRLPVVTTPVGAEGFALRHGENALVAQDAAAFADAIVALYRDPDLWAALAAGAQDVLRPFSSAGVVATALRFIEQVRAERRALGSIAS